MRPEAISTAVTRVYAIESFITALRRSIDGEQMPESDRQYLSRCFDLLTIELGALRQYLGEMRGSG